jgi:mannose/fructose/N-acetylgalactosamine-specific phosphotransferase system component IID
MNAAPEVVSNKNNYRYEIEEGRHFYNVHIFANSDCIGMGANFENKKEAESYGNGYIKGIKFARGEL